VCVYQYMCTSLFSSYDIGRKKSQVLSSGMYVCGCGCGCMWGYVHVCVHTDIVQPIEDSVAHHFRFILFTYVGVSVGVCGSIYLCVCTLIPYDTSVPTQQMMWVWGYVYVGVGVGVCGSMYMCVHTLTLILYDMGWLRLVGSLKF